MGEGFSKAVAIGQAGQTREASIPARGVYEISKANQEEQELLQLNKKLRLEIAALKSPNRIQGTAMRDLGFANPQKDQLIIVR
jgi:cell division protein FtsL